MKFCDSSVSKQYGGFYVNCLWESVILLLTFKAWFQSLLKVQSSPELFTVAPVTVLEL